jgi:ABC-2 type transport system permease protein
MSISRDARGQFAAVAKLRWQLFINSLRTARGRMELGSRVVVGIGFAGLGFGGAFALGSAALFFVSQEHWEWLAALLWPVFLFWQLFPVMATAFTENFDSSNLLRFPLTYRTFFILRVAYGSLDPATALGCLWLTGIAVGIGLARPGLGPWAAIVLLAFAVLNILIGRTVFAWVERWLARRRTREILGILFFLVILSIQFIGPLANYFDKGERTALVRVVAEFLPLERVLPPGLAAAAIARAAEENFSAALAMLLVLTAYGTAIAGLLHLRLRAQYRGENLGETAARSVVRGGKSVVRAGWGIPGVPGPIAAIVEKEFRYLSRSGPMLFTLVMPSVVLLIFRFTPSSSGNADAFLVRAPDLAFPVGAAYALLVLSNLVYNNFGADGAGVQFYFAAPVRFYQVQLAKNLTHAAVLGLETALVWTSVCLIFRPPSVGVTLATLSGIMFALLVNLAVGNLLSVNSPKKIDFGTFGRQRASNTTVFASFGVQIVVFGLAAVVLLAARAYSRIWLATLLFLGLSAIAFVGYTLVLSRAEKEALANRETLIAELTRA